MEDMKIWYDRDGDYLEVLFEDAPATMEEIEEDVFERRTSDGRVIGFAVVNFTKHQFNKLTLPLSIKATPTE